MVVGAPYSAPPTPAAGLALATTILLGIMVLLSLVVAAVAFNEYSVVDDIVTGSGDSTFDDLLDADDAHAGGLVFFYLGWIGTGIVFICWQYRHSRNARSLAGPGGLGPAWAIAGWFIPFANWILPGIELFQSSRASSPPVPGGGPRSGKGSGLVIVWIIALALGLAGLAASLSTGTAEDNFGDMEPETVRTLFLLGAVGGLILAVAAVLGAIMVQSLTKRQTQRIHQVYGGGTFVPWGAQPPPAWGPAPQQAAPWTAPAPPPVGQPPPWGAPEGAPSPPGPPGPAPWQPPTQ